MCKQGKGRNSFPASRGQAGVQPLPKVSWEDKPITPSVPPLILLPPGLYPEHGLGYPWGQSGSPVLAASPPNSLCTPSLVPGGDTRSRKGLGAVQRLLRDNKTSLCYQPCVQHKPKHGPSPAGAGKLTLPQPKPSTSPVPACWGCFADGKRRGWESSAGAGASQAGTEIIPSDRTGLLGVSWAAPGSLCRTGRFRGQKQQLKVMPGCDLPPAAALGCQHPGLGLNVN